MKHLATVLLFFSLNSFGLAKLITASGGSPIPTAFSVSDTQSNVLVCGITRELEIDNDTGSALFIGFKDSGTLPSFDYAFILSGPKSGRVFRREPPENVFGNGTAVYIRSASGSPITSGTVAVTCL